MASLELPYSIGYEQSNHDSNFNVLIALQLGAFGFLSSDEVSRYGTPNAGLYGQPSIFSSFPQAIQQRDLVLTCRGLTETKL